MKILVGTKPSLEQIKTVHEDFSSLIRLAFQHIEQHIPCSTKTPPTEFHSSYGFTSKTLTSLPKYFPIQRHSTRGYPMLVAPKLIIIYQRQSWRNSRPRYLKFKIWHIFHKRISKCWLHRSSDLYVSEVDWKILFRKTLACQRRYPINLRNSFHSYMYDCRSIAEQGKLRSIMASSSTTSVWRSLVQVFVAILLLALLLMRLFQSKRRRLNLPPGPKPWPIVGNLLRQLGHAQTVAELTRKYGKVMFLRLGSRPALITSDPEMIDDIMKVQDVVFCSRPQTICAKYLTYEFHDFIMAPHEDHWRNMRRICVTQLLSPARLESSCERWQARRI